MQTNINPCVESEKEVKIPKEHKSIVITRVKIQDDFDLILRRFYLHKAFRILAWILRFISNCRKNKTSDPLTTKELVNKKKITLNNSNIKQLVATDLKMIQGG